MAAPTFPGPSPSRADALVAVLHATERTRVIRIGRPGDPGSVIRKEALGPGSVQRVRHELRLLERLAGMPGVVQLAAERDPDELLMRDDGGRPLAAVIAGREPRSEPVLPAVALVDLSCRLARVIADVHRAGVVHADINPTNILVCGDGVSGDGPLSPVLIDFHLATTFTEGVPPFGHHRDIVGTLPYVAPEQSGRTAMSVDERADLYGLGATLYELGTGRPPFDLGDPLAMVHDVLTQVPVPPAERDPRLPRAFSDIVMRLLEKEPDRRYQSADGLARDLARLRDELADGRDETFPLGGRDFPRRLSAPARPVGRDGEIAVLDRALAGTLTGGSCAVLVAGAPGVGKTALVNTLRAAVTSHGGWFVTGKFDQYRRDLESDAVLQALRALGRLLLAGSESEVAQARSGVTAALGPSRALLADLPELATLLELDGAPEAAPVGEANTLATRQREAMVDLLRAVASPQRPIVVVLDDLQWAGPGPISVIDALLTDDRTRGILIVGAYRDAEVDPAHPLTAAMARWERLGVAPTAVRLENLPALDLSALLAEMLRLPPEQATDLAEAIGASTGGNPFDTIELLNGLRRDGALTVTDSGWSWDAGTIRRFIGQGDVVDLLGTRLEQLPRLALDVLEVMACLGGEVEPDVLAAACGLGTEELLQALLAPLEDGLLVLERGGRTVVRFRHDRVQQAAHNRLEANGRDTLALALARRLTQVPRCGPLAAEQYLSCVAVLSEPEHRDEARGAAGLFIDAAAATRVLDPAAAGRFLSAALTLIGHPRPGLLPDPAEEALLARAQRLHHAVLCSLGRLAETDAVYAAIERASTDPADLVESACSQVSSLTSRGRPGEAVELGLALLRRLGVEVPDGTFGAQVEQRREEVTRWARRVRVAEDVARPEPDDPGVRLASTLIKSLMGPSFFCDPAITAWLFLTSQRLWVDHGPYPPMVANLAGAVASTINMWSDYRTGYEIARHVLAVAEARDYEPYTSYARQVVFLTAQHWFEPLEQGIHQGRLAREGLLRGGDLPMACYSHRVTLTAMLECAPSLDSCADDAEQAIALARRTGNEHGIGVFTTFQRLVSALRSETVPPGSFATEQAGEDDQRAALSGHPMAAAYFHIYRAVSAAIYADADALGTHATAAMAVLSGVTAFYPVALAHLMLGLSSAQQLRAGPAHARDELLARLDASLGWLTARAADAPGNLGHLATFLRAERDAATGDTWGALQTFDAARYEASGRQRPWHQALITERAALFHLESGLRQSGRDLLADAARRYAAWGAAGKVTQLGRDHPFLRAARSSPGSTSASSSAISADQVDMLAILRTSQALSSETSPDRLRARVGELLGAMTGATTVLIAVRDSPSAPWLLWDTLDGSAAAVPLADDAAAGRLPLSAFRYCERAAVPLLVEDAVMDDRFARDPYLASAECSSLLVVPLLSKGTLRAILILENRQRRGAFTADRLDAVMLITGQLTVSLDNAQLYDGLERKVDERTIALASANRALEVLSNTDALTGLPNRRRFDAALEAEWQTAVGTGRPLGLAMIDVDRFKAYNDRYGHQAGDDCLRAVATALSSVLRGGSDLACRYGGEEFAVLLPGAELDGARLAGERLRSAVAALALPHADSAAGCVTISVGVASLLLGAPGSGRGRCTSDDLVAAADSGLYAAKDRGRNQVAAGPLPDGPRPDDPGPVPHGVPAPRRA